MIYFYSFLCISVCFCTSFAIRCPSCNDIYFDATNTTIFVNQFHCELTDISASLCKNELFVDLVDPYFTVIKYITAPTNALITGNGETELITIMNIPLDIGYPYASIAYNCYDKDMCNNNNVMQDRYEELIRLNYTKLESQLGNLLYNDKNILEEDQIECHSTNKTLVTCCTNWQCQATVVIESGRADSLTTTCIPDRRPGARTGLIIQSKSIGDDYKKITLSYICNKHQCNNPSIVDQVRQLLVDVKLIDSKANSAHSLSLLLIIICFVVNIL
ncbi:unnamed protein product [Adineta ricciae]|uniref:Uncharacterized protein n=1 Tax=Adineta ricciae TaxID=249248 RepID=A0A813ZH82_ADIRI|nr:unnamed protein product [Adineta ricciae]